MSVLCPEPEMPVMTVNRPIGKRDIDVLQIVRARAFESRASARPRLTSAAIPRIGCSAARASSGRSPSPRLSRFRASVPCATTSPPCDTRARAEIDDVIGAAHRFFVVLDDDERVALSLQRRRACRAAARCRAGAGRWSARRARRARRADSSRAAPRAECAALSPPLRVFAERLKREITEPDLAHEVQPLLDLRNDVLRDRLLASARNFSLPSQVERFAGRERR